MDIVVNNTTDKAASNRKVQRTRHDWLDRWRSSHAERSATLACISGREAIGHAQELRRVVSLRTDNSSHESGSLSGG